MERVERYLHRRYVGRSTPEYYLSDLRLFAQGVSSSGPREIQAVDVDRFVEHHIGDRLRPATIQGAPRISTQSQWRQREVLSVYLLTVRQ